MIERILRHIGEDPTAPRVLPARSPPQLEMDFAQTARPVTRPEMNQMTECPDDPLSFLPRVPRVRATIRRRD